MQWPSTTPNFKARITLLPVLLALALFQQSCALLLLYSTSDKVGPLTHEQAHAFQNATTTRILVSEEYEDSLKLRLPFSEYAGKVIRYAILMKGRPRISSENAQTSEMRIEIKSYGELLSATYRREGKAFDWQSLRTGVSLNGEIAFKMNGVEDYVGRFSYRRDPVRVISPEHQKFLDYQALGSAEYKLRYAFTHSDFLRTFILMTCNVHGDDFVLDAAFREKDQFFVDSALSIMASLPDRFRQRLRNVLLTPASDEIKHRALRALAWNGDTASIFTIAPFCLDRTFKYRSETIRSLALIKDRRILPTLADCLAEGIRNKDCDLLRDCAYVAINQVWPLRWLDIEQIDPRVTDLIIKSLEICGNHWDSNWNDAVDYLQKTSGQNLRYTPSEWNEWFREHRKLTK